MRRSPRALAALLAAALAVPAALGLASAPLVGPAAAACAAPTITVEPERAAPGDQIVVTGKGFQKGCPDTGGASPAERDTGVKIFFDQAGKTWHIGTINANQQYEFRAPVYVPNGDGVHESPYGQHPQKGAAKVRAVGTNGEPTDDFEVTQSSGPTTSTTRAGAPSTTTTTKAGGAATTTTAARATTTSTTADDEADDPDEPTTTLPPVVTLGTTSTTEAQVAAVIEDDDDRDALVAWGALALVLLAAVIGTVAWRSRRPVA